MIKLGREVEGDGRVPDSQETSVFASYDTIHVSIPTTVLPPGTAVRIAIFAEGTNQRVWGDRRSVVKGRSHVSFSIGPGELAPAWYYAVVLVDERKLADRAFKVSDGKG